MNVLNFTYTKDNGDVSKRNLWVLVKPAAMYEGIDFSSLEDSEEKALFMIEMQKAYTEYLANILKVQQTYDLNKNYRKFDPKKMSYISTEEL